MERTQDVSDDDCGGEQNGDVSLSTVDEDEYPRPVAIDVISHDGIRKIWMSAYRTSEKARHLMSNQKADGFLEHFYSLSPNMNQYLDLKKLT